MKDVSEDIRHTLVRIGNRSPISRVRAVLLDEETFASTKGLACSNTESTAYSQLAGLALRKDALLRSGEMLALDAGGFVVGYFAPARGEWVWGTIARDSWNARMEELKP